MIVWHRFKMPQPAGRIATARQNHIGRPGVPHTRSGRYTACCGRLMLGTAMLGTLFSGGFAPIGPGIAVAAQAVERDDSADLASQVRTLVLRLSDDQLAVRREAEQQLWQLGPRILPLLPAASERVSAETTHRVARVRQKLEQARANAAIDPTAVTLPDEPLSLSEILARVTKQTGNQLRLRDTPDPAPSPLQLKPPLAETHFWPALDQILDQAHLTIYHFSPESELLLVDVADGRRARSGCASYAGPFRFEAIRVDAHRQLRNPTGRGLTVTIEIAWEPRLRPIGLTQPLADVRAFGPNDQPIVPRNAEAELTPSVPGGTTAIELQLPFALPPRSVEKIARLEGQLIALVPGKTETFRFDRLTAATPREKQQGSVMVALDSVRKNRDIWEVRMRIRYDDPSGALASHRGWIFNNRCYLVGADGAPVEHVGLETAAQSETEVRLAFLFDLPKGPAQYTLLYETPVTIVHTPIKYTLRDILLP